MDRSPIIVITASPPPQDLETNCLQGFLDQVALAKPLTKLALRVTTVEDIPRLTSLAFRTALSGAPGPVLLDFSINAMFSPPMSLDKMVLGSINTPLPLPPSPDPVALQELVKLWTTAARPVIVAGTGAIETGYADPASGKSPLLELAEQTSTPVFYTTKAAVDFPHDHPLKGGNAANLAALPYLSKARPDLVILLGSRTSWMLAGSSGAMLPSNESGSKLVQVDVDGSEIGRSLPIHLGIISDANSFISSFLATWRSSKPDANVNRDSEWMQTIPALKTLAHPGYLAEPQIQPDGRVHPFHAIHTLFNALAPYEPIILLDGAECSIWANAVLDNARPTLALHSNGYLAFLGSGWGYSLGASVATKSPVSSNRKLKDRLVINLQGDGSAGFHIAELDTYARHELQNVLTVVVNNSAWGMSVAGQDIVYNSSGDPDAAVNRQISMLSPRCDFAAVAQGFGCVAAKVSEIDQIGRALEKVLGEMKTHKTGGLLELIVSITPVTNVSAMAVGKPENYDHETSDVILVPYYQNLPRPFYKNSSM